MRGVHDGVITCGKLYFRGGRRIESSLLYILLIIVLMKSKLRQRTVARSCRKGFVSTLFFLSACMYNKLAPFASANAYTQIDNDDVECTDLNSRFVEDPMEEISARLYEEQRKAFFCYVTIIGETSRGMTGSHHNYYSTLLNLRVSFGYKNSICLT